MKFGEILTFVKCLKNLTDEVNFEFKEISMHTESLQDIFRLIFTKKNLNILIYLHSFISKEEKREAFTSVITYESGISTANKLLEIFMHIK